MSDPDVNMDVDEARYHTMPQQRLRPSEGVSVMNYVALQEIARQRQSESREQAARQRATSKIHPQYASLRVRTGWTLVGLGLKLAIPGQQRPATPSAARS
jgi:hypothetical protein